MFLKVAKSLYNEGLAVFLFFGLETKVVLTCKDLDGMTDFAKIYGAKGLAWLKVEEDSLTGPIAKFFSEEEQTQFRELLDAKVKTANHEEEVHSQGQAATAVAKSIYEKEVWPKKTD